jgi:hypothetical protein
MVDDLSTEDDIFRIEEADSPEKLATQVSSPGSDSQLPSDSDDSEAEVIVIDDDDEEYVDDSDDYSKGKRKLSKLATATPARPKRVRKDKQQFSPTMSPTNDFSERSSEPSNTTNHKKEDSNGKTVTLTPATSALTKEPSSLPTKTVTNRLSAATKHWASYKKDSDIAFAEVKFPLSSANLSPHTRTSLFYSSLPPPNANTKTLSTTPTIVSSATLADTKTESWSTNSKPKKPSTVPIDWQWQTKRTSVPVTTTKSPPLSPTSGSTGGLTNDNKSSNNMHHINEILGARYVV